ncbi:olfactory receptor 11L1-like [Bombina bombina]|uniref:olfactory receptor 11L1-like n=1 Tax=Bombina bombina TaxID=8345 RepID=UPI00235AEA1C|nr:olfactory receptor 11L1-like [Bombina bombina]
MRLSQSIEVKKEQRHKSKIIGYSTNRLMGFEVGKCFDDGSWIYCGWLQCIYPEYIMPFTNQNNTNEFVIMGLISLNTPHISLFVIFLFIFLVTLTGNVIILTVVWLDQSLQTPMYFYLTNLSFLEIWYTATIVPKLLANLLMKYNNISFANCMTQLFFFVTFGASECYLLLIMAYDRYLAICKPLYYHSIMNTRTCLKLVAGSWIFGVLTGLMPVLLISQLDFCGSREINHFFCDIPPLLKLSCSDTYSTEISIFVLSLLVLFCSLMLTLVSYIFIVISIFHIKSSKGRRKTFSTCGAHLIVVLIYYGTMIFMYVRPHSSYSSDMNKFISVFYTVVTPGLNPIIYSLRNKDVKVSLQKLLRRMFHP